MKFQLAKLYRGDSFCGFGIAVNGQLLDSIRRQLPWPVRVNYSGRL